MKKLLLLFAVLLTTVGAWAQMYQKVPHTKWTVTAPNQSATNGNEGGVAFIKDENPSTFYHSDWGGSQPGKNGLQGFLIDMAEEMTDIYKITYTGRSDNNTSGWARGVKIYLYNTLPDGLTAELNTLSHDDKETLFKNEVVLGTPAFDNTQSPWANDRTLKTATFTEAKTARYVLFVMHSGNDAWLTCSDFHVWQKVDGIVADKPYYLKINGLDGNYYLDTRVGERSDYGNTICKTQTPVATYFTLSDGYWHISSFPGHEKHFVGVTNWDAIPGKDNPANWTLHEVEEGLWSLAQSTYYGNGEAIKHYLGANDGDIDGQSKLYTDKTIEQAVKFELVELTELETAKENARVTLSKVGVGYPATNSEARTTLQAAVDAADATTETINAAIETYKSYAQVQMPEVGKVYRLISAVAGFATKKAIYSDNVEARWQSRDDAAMNQLWVVQSIADEKIVLMNVNDALYPQKLAANTLKMLPIEKENDLTFLGDGQFKIADMHANGHGNGTGNNGNIIQYNAGLNSATAWRFEEVAVSEDIKNSLIGAVENTYVNSLLIEQEGLEEAVEAARANTDHAAALAGLVAAVATADAQYIDLGYFYMKSKSGQKYAYNNGDDLKAKDEKVKQSIFKLAKADATTFYIQSGNGLYAQVSSQSQQTKIAANQVKFTISKKADGYYVLRAASSDAEMAFWHQDGSSNIVGWRTAASDNSHWVFEPLSEEEVDKIYTVTNIEAGANAYLTYNGTYEAGDKDVKNDGGFYVLNETPETTDFTIIGVEEGLDTKISIEGKSIFAIAGINTENVYIIRSFTDNSYARYHSGCTMSATDDTNMLTWENNNLHWESLFYIEEGTDTYAGYYTIRPVSAPNLYVYNLKSADEDSKVATKEHPAEGDLTANYYWKISTFGAEYANITPHGADDCGWNKRGSYKDAGYNHIGYWKGHNNADANKWIVRKAEEELIDRFMPYTIDDSTLGLVTHEAVNSMLPYIQMITQERFNNVKNGPHDLVTPKPGSFYRFKHPNKDAYMLSNAYNNNPNSKYLAMGAIGEGTNNVTSVFYCGETGNLLSYAIGRYLSNADGTDWKCLPVGTVGNVATFGRGTKYGVLGFYIGSNSSRAYYSGSDGFVNAGGTFGSNAGYDWVVEKVESLPVTITSAGYATFYCPVAVTLPEGLEAYYVGETTSNSAKMTPIEGVIPANTGVILKGDANTYNFNIVADVDPVADNKLAGTVASAYVTDDAYVLSKQDEVVGMYMAAKNQQSGASWLNNGFKAYLPKPVDTPAAARFFVFDFGGNETGIDELEAENENVKTEIYDLAGRRVQNAQKGVFVVNGKVVIK